MEENVDPVHIYLLVKNQLIVSMNGPVDINHVAIHEAMRLYKVDDPCSCFEKVIILADHFISKYQESKE